ncbi:hypothetical protein BDF20DRAFT_836803 [Mycotypha africana]|uniref:uncharacterized protein n=1 Tax=Mycotypha africana TaxID=64632 RepID=UPI0023008FEA|nr:uncharacterized protein BDF20DRAFT_836803 [Mycotypha africana]KAI8975395.1 hypothetical protein BDF20DRAFT_836803 [Mycotypha africana]
MPKLKYKEHRKDVEHTDKYRRHKRKKKHKSKNEGVNSPPHLLEEESGWIPPSHASKEDQEWREHLFDVMLEDEGQDPFYTNYNHTPTSSKWEMTDEEYRQYIVDGMYKKKNAEKIEAEEKLRRKKNKEQKEKDRIRREQGKQHAEQIRLQNVYRQVERTRNAERARLEYDAKWTKLEQLSVITSSKDIPWPVISKPYNLESVRSFLILENATLEETKKRVRKEQTRYHPDKFISKYMKKFEGSDKEKELIIARINDISGWLNELWTQVNVP